MANKKGKSKKNASTKRKSSAGPKRPKSRRSGGMSMSGAAMKIANQICSITDPFCGAATGAKYPDSASIRTLAWDAEYYATMSTDATGRAAMIIGSNPNSGYSTVATWTGATMAMLTTTAPTQLPGWTTFASAGVNWRVVSMGVELRSIASAMTNQGSLGVAVIPSNPTIVGLAGVDLDSTNFAQNTRVSANSGTPLAAISYGDGVVSKTMKENVAGGVNFAGSHGNDILVAYITGGPASSAAIQARIVIHYELAFANSSVFNTIATPSAVENNKVQTGSGFVKKALDQVVVGGVKEVERRVMNTAQIFGRSLFSAGMQAIGGYIGGPMGSMAGGQAAHMIMDQD